MNFENTVMLLLKCIHVTGLFSCNFENDVCGMQMDPTADFEFQRRRGPTSTSMTGPNADYSSGIGKLKKRFFFKPRTTVHINKLYIFRKQFPVLYSLMTYHRVYNKSTTTDAISGAGTAYSSGTPEFDSGF